MEEGETGTGIRKNKSNTEGEVDYKSKSGTAWSHSYLNQKPWHPLSYPNQRRKWIAEQTHANRNRRADEVAREYAQEQESFRQTALLSNKDKEKMEIMRAVSFMYVRPPGYDAESARAAEISDQTPAPPKDVFGRSLPTEQQFPVLKNAPRLETGVAGRVKPFGVEVRNVKCLRCGNHGHQSGDRECPLKDAMMPNEHSRLQRDDPLTAILVHTDPSEPVKWELKQKPGISPPRGGFKPDDPNQQIVAEEIFDEYGGFLSGGDIPELLSNFSSKPKKKLKKKKSKHRKRESSSDSEESGEDEFSSASSKEERRSQRRNREKKEKARMKETRNKNKSYRSVSSSSEDSELYKDRKKSKNKGHSSEISESGRHRSRTRGRRKWSEDRDDDGFLSSDNDRDMQPLPTKVSARERHHRRKRHEHLHHSSNGCSDGDGQSMSKGKEKRRNLLQQSDSEAERRHSRMKEKGRERFSMDSGSNRHHRSYR